MSLEQNIKDLTVAINNLTDIIKFELAVSDEIALRKADIKDRKEAKQETTEVLETLPTDEVKEELTKVGSKLTVSDLKEKCLLLVRENGANKDKIRAVLDEYKAKTINDIHAEKIEEVAIKLDAIA